MSSMFGPVEEAKKWQNIQTGKRIHPYGHHRLINSPQAELVSRETTDEDSFRRTVLIKDGSYEVWVLVKYIDDYGYSLQPDEKVSESVFDAIVFKLKLVEADTMRGADSPVSFEEARERILEPGIERDGDAMKHLIIALYLAAKMDSTVEEETVLELREYVREQTGYVDTSDPEVVRDILTDVLD